MNSDAIKKNNPELLVDWNGNAVQAWGMGGRTIQVNGSFVCESTLMRLCNTGSSTVFVKLKSAKWDLLVQDGSDEGTPILPNTAITVSVPNAGMEFETDGSLYVTFCYDHRVVLEGNEPQYPQERLFYMEGVKVGDETISINEDLNEISWSGIIPKSAKGCNKVAISFYTFNTSLLTDFSYAYIYMFNPQTQKPYYYPASRYFKEDGEGGKLVSETIYIEVKKLPFKMDVMIRPVPDKSVYDERFSLEIPCEEGTFLQIG